MDLARRLFSAGLRRRCAQVGSGAARALRTGEAKCVIGKREIKAGTRRAVEDSCGRHLAGEHLCRFRPLSVIPGCPEARHAGATSTPSGRGKLPLGAIESRAISHPAQAVVAVSSRPPGRWRSSTETLPARVGASSGVAQPPTKPASMPVHPLWLRRRAPYGPPFTPFAGEVARQVTVRATGSSLQNSDCRVVVACGAQFTQRAWRRGWQASHCRPCIGRR